MANKIRHIGDRLSKITDPKEMFFQLARNIKYVKHRILHLNGQKNTSNETHFLSNSLTGSPYQTRRYSKSPNIFKGETLFKSINEMRERRKSALKSNGRKLNQSDLPIIPNTGTAPIKFRRYKRYTRPVSRISSKIK